MVDVWGLGGMIQDTAVQELPPDWSLDVPTGEEVEESARRL